MCDARVLAAVVLIAAAAPSLAAPAMAVAQNAELEARIDSLLIEVDRRASELRQYDSVQAAAARRIATDTTVAGPFLIVERAGVDVSRVAAAFHAVWREYAPLVGDEQQRVRGTLVTMRLPSSFFAGSGQEAFRFHLFATDHSDFATTADYIVRGALTRALPADVRDWLSGETLRLSGALDWAYRDLATSSSYAAHGCFTGETTACRDALGLVDPGDDWSRWYSVDQVRQLLAVDPQLRTEQLEAACLQEGDDRACLEAMRGRGGPRPPLSGTSRATLLQYALRRGGAGAWERLFDDAPDIVSRLEHAAGIPAAELFADWRAAVQHARPDTRAGLAGTGAWTLLWVAGLALLAARSTRWRLG